MGSLGAATWGRVGSRLLRRPRPTLLHTCYARSLATPFRPTICLSCAPLVSGFPTFYGVATGDDGRRSGMKTPQLPVGHEAGGGDDVGYAESEYQTRRGENDSKSSPRHFCGPVSPSCVHLYAYRGPVEVVHRRRLVFPVRVWQVPTDGLKTIGFPEMGCWLKRTALLTPMGLQD